MLRVMISGLRARKLRLLATALSVVLGVGFVAGTLIFSDTSKAAMYDSLARFARNVDVSVRPETPRSGDAQPVAPELLDSLGGIDGVGRVSGRIERSVPLLDKRGKLAGTTNNPGTGYCFGDVPELQPFDVKTGRPPAKVGEAALDVATAARAGYQVGDRITVLDTEQRRHDETLVGILDFGSAKNVADSVVVVLAQPELVALTGATGYDHIVATVEPGASPVEVSERVRAALRSGVAGGRSDLEVMTGDRYRFDLVDAAITQLTPFLTAILIFAGIACVVAAFVIYNTFTILIAQRTRETALLRCVGASKGQIFRSVLLESGVVGLLGSAIGFLLGFGVAYGLGQGFGAIFGASPEGSLGTALSGHAPVVTVTPIVAALALGVTATMVSALLPAVRATRVSPLAALTSAAVAPAGRARRRVAVCVAAALVMAGGTALTVAGLRGRSGFETSSALVVAGGLANFLAVLLVAPLFIGPLIAVAGWLPGRLFGVPFRLAVANARRSPGRTAATTAALMIGVGLMSASSVTTETVRTTADYQITNNYPIDYTLRPALATGSGASSETAAIPPTIARTLAADERLGIVASVRIVRATVNGGEIRVAALPADALARLPKIELAKGSIGDLRGGSVILENGSPEAKGLRLGDPVRVTTATGRAGEFTLVGLASGRIAGANALLSWDDLAELRERDSDDLVFVKAASGVGPSRSRAAVLAVTDGYPMIRVDSMAETRAQITATVDTLIAIIAALLGFAIVIALIGIANTLSLSVLERTRESATTRALGLTRGQLRGALLIEAVLMAVVAAVLGTGFGVCYGWATTRVLFEGFDAIMTIPVGQLLGYLAIAAVAAMLAAVLPARRAARASIVAAMARDA